MPDINLVVIPKMLSRFDYAMPNASIIALHRSTAKSLEVIDLNRVNEDYACRTIECTRPNRILFSCMIDSYGDALKFAIKLREIIPDTILVAGGPHITLLGNSNGTNASVFDVLCLGECEGVLDNILNDARSNETFQQMKVWDTGPGKPCLASHFWENWNQDWTKGISEDCLPVTMIEASRGCKWRCHYCSHSALAGSRVRYRPLDSIIDEIKAIHEVGVSHFRFTDSVLTSPHDRFIELCSAIKKYSSSAGPIHWVCFARTMDLNAKIINSASAAGCIGMFVGVESPKGQTLNFLRKSYDRSIIRDAILAGKDRGLFLFANYIFGLPGDSEDDWKEIVENILDLKFDSANVNPFYLAPGSRFAERPSDFGITILQPNWVSSLHELYFSKDDFFQTSTMTQYQMRSGVLKTRSALEKSGIPWNLKDYHVLAWHAVGGQTNDLIRLWPRPYDHLSGEELASIEEMQSRGAANWPNNSSHDYRNILTNAAKKARDIQL